MIAVVVDPAGGISTGGGQKYAATVAMALAERGYDVYMPPVGGKSATMHLREGCGVTVADAPRSTVVDLFVYTEPMYVQTIKSYFEHLRIKRSVLLSYYFQPLEREAVALFDDVLCISEVHADLCAEGWKIKRPVVIAPGATPIEFIPDKKRDLVLTYSRLDKYKGHSVSMRFARTFLPDWEYISMGFIGQDKEELTALEAMEIDVRGDATIDERDEVLQASSICMFLRGLVKYGAPATDLEGWGICLVESMSAGVVPIAYAGGGHIDIITEGSGILVETEKDVMAALRTLSTDRDYREQLMHGAAKRARELDIKIWLPRLVDYLIDGRQNRVSSRLLVN